jgi:predicted enzyme related to lactoylglutathione lyase
MNAVSWVEVPVRDMQRAIKFYNSIFGWDLQEMQMGPLSMAWFPGDPEGKGSGGSLVLNEHYVPSADGSLIYFSCDNVKDVVDRVVPAGGNVLREKTMISPDIGFMGLAIDTEGNRIAFHSQL